MYPPGGSWMARLCGSIISTRQGAAPASSGSFLIMAVTFTRSSTRSSDALYGASGSIELTIIMISATPRDLSEGADFTSQELRLGVSYRHAKPAEQSEI